MRDGMVLVSVAVWLALGCAGKADGDDHGASGGSSASGGASSSASGGAALGTGGSTLTSGGQAAIGWCTPFNPCGGNVVGTWKIVGFCQDADDSPDPDCAEAQVTYTTDATAIFNADGTFAASGTLTTHRFMPAACAQYCSGCAPSADGGCVCDSSTMLNDPVQAYAVRGALLIARPGEASEVTIEFCANPRTMSMRGVSGNRRYQYELVHL
ncbi:MAG: hypothetical protein QM756_35905 [Polyangiaceae bacterium]